MRSNYLFTSESVSEGHPDKVADQISDAVVDLFLSKDPEARVACETMVTTSASCWPAKIRAAARMIDTEGNWAPGAQDEIERPSRETVKIGYEQDGFHWQTPSSPEPPPRPVRAYRAGRRRKRQQGRGRGRSGHHVRLRDRRDAGPAAGHALLFAPHPRAAGRRPHTRRSISSSPTPRAR
jgi:hypothetical protein